MPGRFNADRARSAGWRRSLVACLASGLGCLVLSSAALAASGGIYLVSDADDAIHLTDHPEGPATRLWPPEAGRAPGAGEAAQRARAVVRPPNARVFDASADAAIRDAARTFGLEEDLIRAVIAVESGEVQRAVSPRGAMGLMQLMPATARALGTADLFDVRENVFAGARQLRHLNERFGADLELVLAAYNAGEGAVERHGNRVPPYAETLAYVPRVLQVLSALRSRAPH
ncbi:MAG TPA: lytic transglycosylase domain-containing protein [Caldimonas sp.]|nr:lytic transglycosylase domain-containing protein [Caldimonas sp.]